MRFLQSFILLSLLFAFNAEGTAQQLRENEVVVIRGEKYVLHQVRTGETIYSISNQFNIGEEVLIKHNPEIGEGLKIGEVLKIPFRDGAKIQEKPVYQKGDPSSFTFHTIRSRKETPYFIAREYGITVEELYAYNPEVKRFRKGTKLRIPHWEAPEELSVESSEEMMEPLPEREEEQQKGSELIRHEVVSGETLYSIARRYHLSESEILFYNPGARELKAGSVIYLPRTEETLAAEKKSVEDAEKEEIKKEEKEPLAVPEPATSEISSSNYFEHTIVSGETLWGVAHKYNVDEDKLREINPVLRSGFPAGVNIKIPVKQQTLPLAEPVNEDAFIQHQVKQGETLYGLADEYGMSIPEIRKFNPVLENRNLVYGETLLIPRKPDEEIVEFMDDRAPDSLQVSPPSLESDYYEIEVAEVIPEHCRQRRDAYFSDRTYDVALFLPFFTYANDTLNRERVFPDSLVSRKIIPSENDLERSLLPGNDTLVERELTREMFHGFYGNSENFLQFYEGVLIAVDSMQQTGMNIRLNVFDTQQNRDSVRKFIYSDQFLKTDLIIGPVYPEVQSEVSDLAAKNRIPMVSPLASQSAGLEGNPYLYQINPSRDYLAVKTAELIAEEYFNSNFIVFKTGKDDAMGEKVIEVAREKLFQSGYWGKQSGVNFSVYDFDREGPFGFRRILSHKKENVVFIPSLNEGALSVALSNINNLSDEYSITLIGLNRYDRFNSIDRDFFHNLKLHYIDPYWVDYQKPETIRFIRKFRENFYTEPDNFGFQGYDVAMYFLTALKVYGRDFNECLPYIQTDLVQGNYQFQKVSSFGGYMNQGVSVLNYQRDYDVVRKRVIGKSRFASR